MSRSEKEILYDLMPEDVDWVNGTSDWVDVSKFWASVPSTWPGNGSVLFNEDRGIGSDFQIEKKKMSGLSPEDQEIFQGKWETFVRTIRPESLHESLLEKEFTTSTVRFRLLAIGGTSRKGIPVKFSRQMEKEQEHKCVFCGKPGKPGTGPRCLQIDHKDWKKAFTANLTVDDLQYTCPGCNTRKRTALRKHFKGTEILTQAELKWWYDPKASGEAQATHSSVVVSSIRLAADEPTPSSDGGDRSRATA